MLWTLWEWLRRLLVRVTPLRPSAPNGASAQELKPFYDDNPFDDDVEPLPTCLNLPSTTTSERNGSRNPTQFRVCRCEQERNDLPPAVRRIGAVWPTLPPHIQEAILTLIDAAAANAGRGRGS